MMKSIGHIRNATIQANLAFNQSVKRKKVSIAFTVHSRRGREGRLASAWRIASSRQCLLRACSPDHTGVSFALSQGVQR
jgi:hypothetical protein